MHLTPEQLAWAAGFFDGEGCIRLQLQYKDKRWPLMSLKVEVTNADRRPIDLFHSWFDGSHRHVDHVRYKDQTRRYYNWRASGSAAYRFCLAVLPFSIVKREQIELGVQFYALPWRSRGRGRLVARTADQLQTDLAMVQRMKDLKKTECVSGVK